MPRRELPESSRSAPDERGGVIVAWNDYRSDDGYSYVYSQRVDASGLWGNPAPEIVSCLDMPADQGGWVRITTRASSHDAAGEFDSPIFGYNVWRMIRGGRRADIASGVGEGARDRSLEASGASRRPRDREGRAGQAPPTHRSACPEGDWESVGFWFATKDTVYNAAVPTNDDSTEAGTAEETFVVTAHTSTAGVFVASEPAIGLLGGQPRAGRDAGIRGERSRFARGAQCSRGRRTRHRISGSTTSTAAATPCSCPARRTFSGRRKGRRSSTGAG